MPDAKMPALNENHPFCPGDDDATRISRAVLPVRRCQYPQYHCPLALESDIQPTDCGENYLEPTAALTKIADKIAPAGQKS
jgi:hypothetical protein